MESLIWNAVLTVFIGFVGWAIKSKDKELDDIRTDLQRNVDLLSRTREEIAKEYVTKAEVHADINRVLDRLERLDVKLDRLVEKKRSDQS